MSKLLIIDDEPDILQMLALDLQESGLELAKALTAAEGLKLFAQQRPDVILLDIDLPDLSGLEILRQIREVDARVPAIFMTGHGTTAKAIEAMTLGAYEYLLKPLNLNQVREVIDKALHVSRLMRVPAVVETAGEADDGHDLLVGRSPAMQEVYKAIGRVAPQDVTVLVLGESGTGKELVARAIYHYSKRSTGPFLAVNCAAIPETLLESELFGHERGAFTGADRKRIGKFEQCSGGTLFLDEIGDMTPLTQTKVLRVLQDQTFERVGGNETIRTNVRIITATNRNLESLMAAGQFRADLYYRLNVFTIKLPPLRDRGDDVQVLAEHFVRRFNKELTKDIQKLPVDTIGICRAYAWPGNVRELQNVLKTAVLQATGPVLLPEFLASSLSSGAVGSGSRVVVNESGCSKDSDLDQFVAKRLEAGSQNLYKEWQAVAERRLFVQTLAYTGGNLRRAAKILRLHRTTLRTRMAALGIKVGQAVSDE